MLYKILAFTLLIGTALGKPGRRESDPIIIDIDCRGVEKICDAQCHAILCMRAPWVLQHDPDGNANQERYKASGASAVPFKKSYKHEDHGFSLLEGRDHEESAEEYPRESAAQGGRGAILYRVERRMNTGKLTMCKVIIVY
jgi:hypothetical protein